MAWLDRRVKASWGVPRSGMVRYVLAGMVWTGMMWQVEVRLGVAGEAGQGVSRQCAVC